MAHPAQPTHTGLWSERRGVGRALVLLPGGPGMASDYLEPLADLLSDASSVILVDPPGCGRSRSATATDIPSIVAALDGVRASHGIDRWIVAGHSFGADLALAYALEQPRRTTGVLAISPTGVQNDRDWHRAYEEGRSSDQDAQSEYAVDPRVHSAVITSWRGYIQRPDLLRRIAALPTPYVGAVGTMDPRPVWPVEQVTALIPGGRLRRIVGAGHCPWWTHPQEVQDAAAELLAELPGGTPT